MISAITARQGIRGGVVRGKKGLQHGLDLSYGGIEVRLRHVGSVSGRGVIDHRWVDLPGCRQPQRYW